MPPNDADLLAFETWLREGGAADGTIRLYLLNVRSCHADARGVTARLLDRSLAPNTRHTNMAALASWADFREDADLAKRLKRISLPPARRVKPKVPVEDREWQQLIWNVRQSRKLAPAMRSALLLVCMRGMRCADVLRLRPTEVRDGLKTGKLIGEAKGGKRLEYAVAPIRGPLEDLLEMKGFRGGAQVLDLVVAETSRSEGHDRMRYGVKLIYRALKRVAKETGIDGVHPHRMRTTYATGFVRRLERDPRAMMKLQQHMGWAQLTTAARYVDAIDAEELDQLGEDMMTGIVGTEAPPAATPKPAKRPRKR